MAARKVGSSRRRGGQEPSWTPESVGVRPALYASMVSYLFDRPAPVDGQQEWYWDIDEPVFEASPLEWTQLQSVLFANAGRDLVSFDNEQVGMGLNYVMNNAVSMVPFAATDPTVPVDEAMRMMSAMPQLWSGCIGPRLASLHSPIGSIEGGRLAFACYMWFDIWPTFHSVRHVECWRDAVWEVLRSMLNVPCRDVQIAALHGIGHHVHHLDRRIVIDETIAAFTRRLGADDDELRNYAEAARQGTVA